MYLLSSVSGRADENIREHPTLITWLWLGEFLLMPIGLISAKGRESALLFALGGEAFGVDFCILRGDIACDPGRLAVAHEKSGILEDL
jgi:hypothetical protein